MHQANAVIMAQCLADHRSTTEFATQDVISSDFESELAYIANGGEIAASCHRICRQYISFLPQVDKVSESPDFQHIFHLFGTGRFPFFSLRYRAQKLPPASLVEIGSQTSVKINQTHTKKIPNRRCFLESQKHRWGDINYIKNHWLIGRG